MKKLISTMAFLMVTLATLAYDYPYLTFQTADGTAKSIAVDQLVITFADGQLVASNGSDSQTVTLSDLSKMYFTAESGTVSEISTIEGSQSGAVEAFALNGRSMGRFDSAAEAKSRLHPGVYLLKSNNKTIKIAIR